MSRIRTALLLGAAVAALATSPAAHADKPSAIGFRLVWMHERFLGPLDASSSLCSGDARPHEAEARRLAAAIDKALARMEPDRAKLPQRDVDHPDVVAAVAAMDALAACREHIRASLAGELPADAGPGSGEEGADAADPHGSGDAAADDEGASDEEADAAEEPLLTADADVAPATEEGFVSSLSAPGRQALAVLVGFDPASPGSFPTSARELRRVHAVAEVVWPLCTGRFAGLVMGGASDGERAAEADPWRWCRAAAQRVERLKAIGAAMVVRGLAALQAAEAALTEAARGVRAEVEEKARELKGAVAEAKLAAESAVADAVLALREETAEIALIGDLVGLEATAAVDAALDRARRAYGPYEAVVEAVIDELAAKGTASARKVAGKVGAEAKRGLRALAREVKKRMRKKKAPGR